VLVYSFVLTLGIGYLLQKTLGFRLREDDELAGIDNAEHAETGYDLGNLTSTLRGALTGTAPRRAEDTNHDEEVSA
jgi:Amt family ammonium transporter